MSSATVIVRSCGLFWLKPVAMVLVMVCSVVLVAFKSHVAWRCVGCCLWCTEVVSSQCFCYD